MLQILRRYSENTRFASVIGVALDILSSANIERETAPNMLLQSSKAVAELHAFRKRSGYYKEGAVAGLDESIASLAERAVPVRAGLIETDQGYIGVWLDEQDCLLGVMVFPITSGSTT